MKKVTIYSAPGCIYCQMVKDFLDDNEVEYIEVDLSIDTAKRDEVIKKTGQMAVPVVEVDEDLVIGFDKPKLAKLLGL